MTVQIPDSSDAILEQIAREKSTTNVEILRRLLVLVEVVQKGEPAVPRDLDPSGNLATPGRAKRGLQGTDRLHAIYPKRWAPLCECTR